LLATAVEAGVTAAIEAIIIYPITDTIITGTTLPLLDLAARVLEMQRSHRLLKLQLRRELLRQSELERSLVAYLAQRESES
jgi:hypothetical protein